MIRMEQYERIWSFYLKKSRFNNKINLLTVFVCSTYSLELFATCVAKFMVRWSNKYRGNTCFIWNNFCNDRAELTIHKWSVIRSERMFIFIFKTRSIEGGPMWLDQCHRTYKNIVLASRVRIVIVCPSKPLYFVRQLNWIVESWRKYPLSFVILFHFIFITVFLWYSLINTFATVVVLYFCQKFVIFFLQFESLVHIFVKILNF